MVGGEGHRLVTAVEVTRANASDDAKLQAMLEDQDQQGHQPVLGDQEYFDVERARRQAERGTAIVAKAPPAVNREGSLRSVSIPPAWPPAGSSWQPFPPRSAPAVLSRPAAPPPPLARS